MENIFLQLFNISIMASWLILAVLVLRIVFRKAPRYIFIIMWALAGIRLILPFSFESALSLIPSTDTIPPDIVYSQTPMIHSGISALNSAVNPVISESLAPNIGDSVNPIQTVIFFASLIWLSGIVSMLIYSAVSYIKLRLRVRPALNIYDNIYLCDNIPSPFILGIIRPKIYLPSDISDTDSEYVIAHEKAHIKRLDHIWKPIGFLLLTIYWFNPLIWLGYILLCRDIEFATDEKVIKKLGNDIKKDYSNTLINLSVSKKLISACPLAFGETSVKSRIKSVLHYKKPALWIIIIALLSCAVLCICFLTEPKTEEDNIVFGVKVTDIGTEYKDIDIEFVTSSLYSEYPYIEFKWINGTTQTLSYGEEFFIYRDGEEIKPSNDWELPLYSVYSGGSEYDMCSLGGFDISKTGSYRLEKEFYVGESEQKYIAYIDFEIDRTYAFTGYQLSGENLVFNHGSFSSAFYSDESSPLFMISDHDMHLLTSEHPKLSLSSSLYDAGELEKVTLTTESFDALTSPDIWDDGFSAKGLRENNKYAFRVENKEDGRLYYILEQQNGDIYIARGYTDAEVIRWIFKMRKQNEAVTQPLQLSRKQYTYYDSPDPISPSFTLNETEGTFSFCYSGFSSYIAIGSYQAEGNTLILSTSDGKYTYYFTKTDGKYVFDAKRSSEIPKYKYSADAQEALCPVPDGAVFE